MNLLRPLQFVPRLFSSSQQHLFIQNSGFIELLRRMQYSPAYLDSSYMDLQLPPQIILELFLA